MNPYANEDVAWQRLKDMQLEAENHRLAAGHGSLVLAARRLAATAWHLAGLAMQRPPRRRPRSVA
jgi:hypothetical protein